VALRPLRAVLVERATPRLVELLAAALDGSGPAIAPLDAGLPPARLAGLIDALGPDSVLDTEGVTSGRSGPGEGVAEGTAVVVGTSGSTGVPKGVELSAAALRHSARASLDRVGARPGERWLCCLPVTHVAGLAVLVRSLVSGTEPVLAERADAGTVAASGCAHVSLVPTQLQRLLAHGRTPLAGFSSVLLGGAATPPGLLEAGRDAGVPVVTTYGMTETCGGCVYDGVPLDGVRAEVRDDGRIWITGPVLFSGYLGGPRRVPQRGRAQLHPLRHAGGPRGADDDRRTVGDSLPGSRTDGGDSLSVLHRARPQDADQLGQPRGRQPGVERHDGRPAAVKRRRQQLDQTRGRALHQDRAQRAHSHVD